jgi:hypothetical protein
MHPLACAYCSGIVTATVSTTTPSNANAATIAIIAIDVVVFSSYEVVHVGKSKKQFPSRISATKLHNRTIFMGYGK